MLKNQKMVADDGKEVLLFPLEYMNISQGENGGYSHQGILAIDFLGWDANGRVYDCPLYAPCTCKCVYKSVTGAYNIWQSVNPVHCANGTLQWVSWMVIHSETLFDVNTVKNQGEIMSYTGTAGNVTGDHTHLNFSNGIYVGQEQVPPDMKWQLKNSNHIYDLCFINDTVIINDYDYPWVKYDGNIEPAEDKKRGFKWVLYANKLRSRNFINVNR